MKTVFGYQPHNGGARDFDFFHGRWKVVHRRLKERLVGCTEWQEFGGSCNVRPLLGGFGNIDDNIIDLPGGSYRAVTLRSFDTREDCWTIWWLDGRNPQRIDTPMRGRFDQGTGTFFCNDIVAGQAIKVRFLWNSQAGSGPRWEQAFSNDDGASWETNWIMDFVAAQSIEDGGKQ